MGRASPELINMLNEFLICEIGSKAIDGITYAMVLKDKRDEENYKRYMQIRKEAQKCGYSPDETFRVYEVSNGYIFDMDMAVAKRITLELTKAVSKTNGSNEPIKDIIGDNPDKRRKSDMVGLAKYIKKEFDAGKDVAEVALFSRNLTPRIMITAVGAKNEVLMIKYNAFAIRHWDIETVNANLLIPAGIRIAKIEPYEILPSKTGVRFRMYLEPVVRGF